MSNLFLVKTFFNRHEAGIAQGLLEENNIPCTIKSDDCGGMRPHLNMGMGGVQLFVHEYDRERATEILKVLDEPGDVNE